MRTGAGRARRVVLSAFTVASLVVLGLATPAPAEQVSASISWGAAAYLSGFTALVGPEGGATPTGEVCSSLLRCTLFGNVSDPEGSQLFVDDMTDGAWGAPREVPIPNGSLNPESDLGTVTCISPGNCIAYGDYLNYQQVEVPFAVTESDGTWTAPVTPPSVASLGHGFQFGPIACTDVNDCVLGGSFFDGAGRARAFLDFEAGGQWGTAHQIEDLVQLDGPDFSSAVTGLTCPSPGNCLLTGVSANDTDSLHEVYVMEERQGVWHNPHLIPWLVERNMIGDAITAQACPEAGWCTIVGDVLEKDGVSHYFVQSEQSWAWGSPRYLPIPAFFPNGVNLDLQLQCPARGHCTIAGNEEKPEPPSFPVTPVTVPFVVNVVSRVPGPALTFRDPLTGKTKSGIVQAEFLSCVRWSYCGLGLEYERNNNSPVPAVADESNARWSRPTTSFHELSSSGSPYFYFSSILCITTRECATDGSIGGRPFTSS